MKIPTQLNTWWRRLVAKLVTIKCKWCQLVAKFGTYKSGVTWWPKLELIQVLVDKFATNKISLVTDSINNMPLAILYSNLCMSEEFSGTTMPRSLHKIWANIFNIPRLRKWPKWQGYNFSLVIRISRDWYIRKEYFSLLLLWDQETGPRMME